MPLNDDKPGIEEQYSKAVSSSNLRVELDRRSPADILIASGLNNSRLGGALMRLRAEFSSDSVPRHSASETDHRLIMGRLKSLPKVLEDITEQARRWRIDRPEAVTLAVVSHWCDSACRHCNGLGKERIVDAPALSNKNCKHCHGTGRTDLTHGSAGRKIHGYMEDCINRWKQSTARKMYG